MATRKTHSISNRVHIVLVPGFAGFDALGQLEYYYGVTPIYARTVCERQSVLHYFDNLPTAAVETRAKRLHRYLAKRIARGVIRRGDSVALVGHSTGGLDIRQLIWQLGRGQGETLAVDGGVEVTPEQVLKTLRRVVFLSVPHLGTNLADAIRERPAIRVLLLEYLRAVVAGSQLPVVDSIEEWIAGQTADITGSPVFRAAQDSLSEAAVPHSRDASRVAEAQDADSQLSLYLRSMATDFRAIDDLTANPKRADRVSPAHFGAADRAEERQLWKRLGVRARSYATAGKPPGSSADLIYRTTYEVCAGGSDRANDGIVDTASMDWFTGDVVPVEADHMDIVGHYQPVKARRGPRVYNAYDLLVSHSGFGKHQFEQLWRELFEFCCSGRK